MSTRSGTVTDSDVLFHFRLRLFALAAETSVAAACRTLGVHRSTYYRWKHMVERSGIEMLRLLDQGQRRRQRGGAVAAGSGWLALSVQRGGFLVGQWSGRRLART